MNTTLVNGIKKKSKNVIDRNTKKLKINFFKNLQVLGYRYFSLNKRTSRDKKIVRCFQRHYLPNRANGKIDQKTFEISYFLTR